MAEITHIVGLSGGKDSTKQCSRCRRDLPVSEFYRRGDRDALMSRCKTCHCRSTELYRLRSSEVRARRVEYSRRQKLRRCYGITVEQYDAMFEQQGGLCAICNRPEQKKVGDRSFNLSVDHDHQTGTIRALLCHACNSAIGSLGDDPELIRKAANYVERHRNGS